MSLPDAAVSPRTLKPERLQLHYGARLLASVAHSLLKHEDDDSHTNLGLDASGIRLATHSIGTDEHAIVLNIASLALRWTVAGVPRATKLLAGSTMEQAYGWLNETRPPGSQEIEERTFPDFPEHPLGDGARFGVGDEARRVQLGRYFALGQAMMDRLAERDAGVSSRRVWPHHFDIGALIAISSGGTSIGIGLSPGDDYYDEPYFYMSPYPAPPVDSLPVWDEPGHWHTEGFTSLVLTATEWQSIAEAADVVVWRVVEKAVATNRKLLTHNA